MYEQNTTVCTHVSSRSNQPLINTISLSCEYTPVCYPWQPVIDKYHQYLCHVSTIGVNSGLLFWISSCVGWWYTSERVHPWITSNCCMACVLKVFSFIMWYLIVHSLIVSCFVIVSKTWVSTDLLRLWTETATCNIHKWFCFICSFVSVYHL